MSMKVKGLLKGLRYISHIFDKEEELELQIGVPTDVKHVAHIGWDGPATNAPTWIDKFKSGKDSIEATTTFLIDEQNVPRARDSRLPIQEKRTPTGSGLPLESPSRRRSDKSKSSRRQSSTMDSPRKSSTTTSEKSKTKLSPGLDSPPTSDPTLSSKPTRRKKPKATSSKTSSRSKATGYSESKRGAQSGSIEV